MTFCWTNKCPTGPTKEDNKTMILTVDQGWRTNTHSWFQKRVSVIHTMNKIEIKWIRWKEKSRPESTENAPKFPLIEEKDEWNVFKQKWVHRRKGISKKRPPTLALGISKNRPVDDLCRSFEGHMERTHSQKIQDLSRFSNVQCKIMTDRSDTMVSQKRITTWWVCVCVLQWVQMWSEKMFLPCLPVVVSVAKKNAANTTPEKRFKQFLPSR